MRYRPEVDGLRALAVVPVMLFHAGVPYIGGGFVGVDIFFVISGFLITLSLLADENFSPIDRFARFYQRRLRRIIPALALVVTATLVGGVAVLLPHELIQLGKSAVATSLFVSNFWFWSQSGYFAASAQSMPLLHTWSLAVEEQFYIVFPLLLIVLGKGRRIVSFIVVSSVAAAIFVFSVYLTMHKPGVAFYWPTRAWELLLGSMLALAGSAPRRTREVISIAGLLLIAFSLFAFDRTTPFPGYSALVPVLGAVGVIYGGGETFVGRALSLRPLVWIGLISYSLYLWHWPILGLTKQALVVDHLSVTQTMGCIAATFLAAALSWRFVEMPFRKIRMQRKRLFFWAGATLGCGVAAGLALPALQGLPSRFSDESLRLARVQAADKPENCVDYDRFVCQVGVGEPRFLVWGDSHAGALSPAIANIAATPGLYAAFGGCPPLLGLVPDELPGDDKPNCKEHNQKIVEKVATDGSIDVVILAAYWSAYKLKDVYLRDTLDKLRDRHVFIVEDNPSPGFNVPWILAMKGAALPIRPSKLPESFHVVRDYPNVQLVKLSDALCLGDDCPPTKGGHALYADDNHISAYAANTIVSVFLKNRLSGIFPASSNAAR
jgi:peptidoglycan/LPS O-acetylase OafA/YrhL